MRYTFLSILTIATTFIYIEAFSQNNGSAIGTSTYQIKPINIKSKWADSVVPSNNLKEYPRPQMKRGNWTNLNGLWDYAITDSSTAYPTKFDGVILVPYPVESALSGVQKQLAPNQTLWYRRSINISDIDSINKRILLNFGAIDWKATIYINNVLIGVHKGGYLSFSIDITRYLHLGKNELLVKVYDPTDQGPNPHGKQSLHPANIYYTASSGIWQTVWLEHVAASHIENVHISPNIDDNSVSVKISTTSSNKEETAIITILEDNKPIASKKMRLNKEISEEVRIPVPKAKYWSPDTPFLYNLSVKLIKSGRTIDQVRSYFGMRKINIQKDEKGFARIFLNNKYVYNLGTLDQGFWPDGLYTAPTDEALMYDIKAIKSMGFNTIRKHIKVEPDRWYYHADRLGMLVWQDFVNPSINLQDAAKAAFESEIKSTIDQLYNHPCIVVWVLFNERWGAYNQSMLTEWVKNYDSTRLIDGHSGELLYVNDQLRAPSDNPWIGSDLADIHSYPFPRNFSIQNDQVKVLGEFGGIGVSVPEHEWDDIQGWGYVRKTAKEMKEQYKAMMDSIKILESKGLSGSIYTQPFDVEGEENGMITYDRKIIKIPLADLRNINQQLIYPSPIPNMDPKFHIAANLDPNDNDSRYEEMLTQYKGGKRDSTSLRRLILTARRKKDTTISREMMNTYYSCLKQPFSKENLIFLSKIIQTTKDTGFKVFLARHDEVNKIVGMPISEYIIKRIIEQERIDSYLASKKASPDWDSLYYSLKNQFGSIGEEVFFGKRLRYSFDNRDWDNYGKYYMAYYKIALKRPDFNTNELSWQVFLHVTTPEVIEFATHVMKYDIETWDQHAAFAHDTYANLLHKANHSQEAIKWEEKAIQLKQNDQEEKTFAETLQKMKSGQPTWPTKN